MTAPFNGFSLWLADFQLLAAVLLALVLAAAAALGQPVLRMAVFKGSLAALAALAILCSLPGWSVIHLLNSETRPADPAREVVEAQPPRPSVFQPIPHLDVDRIPPPEPQSPARAALVLSAAPQPLESRWDWVIRGYLVGSLLVVLWLAAGAVYAHRLRAGASPAPAELQQLMRRIVGTARPPELLVNPRVKTPAAHGLLRPAIILPAAMVDASPLSGEPRLPGPGPRGGPASDDQESATAAALAPILAHEWAHLQNRDLHTLAACRLLLALLWPQPLYWLLRRRLRLDQETLADAAAAELAGRVRYAEQLLGWARDLPRSYAPRLEAAVGLWEGPSQLKRRIAVLLNERFAVMRRCSRKWRIGSAAVALAAAMGLSLVTLQSGSTSAAAKQTTSDSKKDDQSEVREQAAPPHAAPTQSPEPPPEVQERVRAKLLQLQENQLSPNSIVGVCLDDQGRPVPHTKVSLYRCKMGISEREAELLTTATVDADGKFTFIDVVDVATVFPDGVPDEMFAAPPQTLFAVLAQAPGKAYAANSQMATRVLKEGAIELLSLEPAAKLSGMVTDSNGKPIEGAKVSAGFGLVPGLELNTALTDAEGRYVIDRLEPWDAAAQRVWFEAEKKRLKELGNDYQIWRPEYLVAVRRPGYAVKMATVEKVPGEVDVQLAPGAMIEGRVVFQENGQSAPAADAIVRVTRKAADDPVERQAGTATLRSIQQETAQADSEGRYRIPMLPPGQYTITARAPGWVTGGLPSIEVPRGETVKAPELAMTRGAVVRVQLLDAKTGQPLELEQGQRGFVHAIRLPREPFSMPVLDDNTVRFSATGVGEIRVPPGRYAFSASVPTGDYEQPHWQSTNLGNLDDAEGHSVAEGETRTVTIEMAKLEPPRARVVPATPPADDESVGAEGAKKPSDDPGVSGTLMPIVPPADGSVASVRALPIVPAPGRMSTVAVALDVTPPPTGGDGQLRAGGMLDAFSESPSPSPPSNGPETSASRLQEDSDASDHHPLLTAKVLDAETGEPIAEGLFLAGVNPLEDIGWQWQPHTVQQFRDGRLQWPPPGRQGYDDQMIRVEAQGYVPVLYRVKSSEPPQVVELPMSRDEGVVGRVVDELGEPVAGAKVALGMANHRTIGIGNGELTIRPLPPDASLRDRWSRPVVVESDVQGRFELPTEVVPQTVVVAAHDRGIAAVPYPEFATSGELKLEPWGTVEGRVLWRDEVGAGVRLSLGAHTRAAKHSLVINSSSDTVSDAEGRFRFERVPPGLAQLSRRSEPNSPSGVITLSPIQFITVQSGEPTQVVFGGRGRPVIGRLAGRQDWSGVRIRYAPNAPRPGDADMWHSYSEFLNSPAGQAYRGGDIRVADDGTFRIEAVLPEHYQLFVDEVAADGKTQYIGYRAFSMETTPGNETDEPIDLGEITVQTADGQ